MVRKIVYWTSTVIVAVMLLFALSYLTGNPQVVSGFTKAGYPQHLRIILGIAKPAAAIVLLLPGVCFAQGMGLCGRGFRVGDGVSRPLLGGRWGANMEHSAGAAGAPDRLLRD